MIAADQVLAVYKIAIQIRQIEELLATEYSKGLFRCPTHLSIGQELAPSVLSLFLDSSDQVISTHRSHAHYLAKGGDLADFFDELLGLPSGCSGGFGGSMHLIDDRVGFMGSTAIVANTIPIGVGLAQALSLSKDNSNVVIIYLGDGATEEGVFWESLNYSLVRKLPCLFVIENNQYSVYTDILTRQSIIPLSSKLSGFSPNYWHIKNHDYVDLYSALTELLPLVRARQTACIEIDTFRYREHCGPNFDDDLNYRPPDYINLWKNIDIISILEKSILAFGFNSEVIADIKSSTNQFIHDAYLQSLSRRKAFISSIDV